MVALRLIIFR